MNVYLYTWTSSFGRVSTVFLIEASFLCRWIEIKFGLKKLTLEEHDKKAAPTSELPAAVNAM